MFSPELKALSLELGELLLAKKHVLTLAESCTGGLISALITNTAGSSAWFDSGLVTYSNQAKQDLLKVKETTLSQYGAVSEQTAMEMAIGALQQGRATIAASVTGIAGPDGGTTAKPVGTVCFAWTSEDLPSISKTYQFQGDREQIREQSTIALLFGLKDLLNQQH
ncbi:MAG: hypothetical protein RJB18_1373 [Pseudomonadota bacterium]|jgi:nicotinamide-nucleotide amidase